MPRERFPIRDIQSFMPSVDVRNTEDSYVISGRNYVFDTKGPKSGFGSRLVCGLNSIDVANGSVQDISIAGRTFVCTTQGIYELAENKQSWIQHVDLTVLFEPEYIPFLDQQPWTGAYLSDGVYICHKTYGFYKLTATGLDKITVEDLPGFPERPIAIAETNGRLIVLNQDFVAWSAPSQAERFIPELGGAGQQRLSDRVTGTPLSVVGFQRGFLVWTTEDCLLAEFVGGDTVFRFDRMTTDQIPVGAMAIEELPDGSQIICTKQGLYVTANGGEPKDVTPLFNQFIKDFLKHEPGITVRLDYNMEYDHLYVQLRDWTNHHVRTYVVTVALDRWGEFNERHLGIIRYDAERGSLGYVDQAGVVHKFVDTFNKEVTPHTFEGLDSQIDVGYIKPPRLVEEGKIDTLLEMQELFIGGIARPSWSVPTVIDCGELPAFTMEAGLAAYLRFDGATPFYWVLHAGAQPDGEFFATREELLEAPLLDNEADLSGMRISMPDGITQLATVRAINELHEVCQALMTSVQGVTFALELDSSFGHTGGLFQFQDALDNQKLFIGMESNESGYHFYDRQLEATWWDYYWLFGSFLSPPPPVTKPVYGQTRFTLAMRRIDATNWYFGFAMNGELLHEETAQDFDLATWTPIFQFCFGNSSFFPGPDSNWVAENVSIGNVSLDHLRKLQVYSGGEAELVASRSALVRPETITVYAGNPVNANPGILELTLGQLRMFTPNETAVGDLLIAIVYARSAITPPVGWTLHSSESYQRVYKEFVLGSVVDVDITQTTYVYTRVAEALEDGMDVRFGIATPGICGGIIMTAGKPSGETPTIVDAVIERDLTDWSGVLSDVIFNSDSGEAPGYPYHRHQKSIRMTTQTADADGQVAIMFSTALFYTAFMRVSPGEDTFEATTGQQTLVQMPDANIALVDEASMGIERSAVGGSPYLTSWNYLTNLGYEERNRLFAAWRPLQRRQSIRTDVIASHSTLHTVNDVNENRIYHSLATGLGIINDARMDISTVRGGLILA